MSAAIPILTTPRLILRPLDLTDVDAVQALFPRWEIVRFLGTQVPWPYPADGALTFIRDIALPAMQRGTGWHWSIRPKAAPEQLIGAINVSDKLDDNRGFWLDPAWQGQGLMSEASSAVNDYWFETLERQATPLDVRGFAWPTRSVLCERHACTHSTADRGDRALA